MTQPLSAIHRVSTKIAKAYDAVPARYERLHRIPHGPFADHCHAASVHTSERDRPMQCREGRTPVWCPEEQSCPRKYRAPLDGPFVSFAFDDSAADLYGVIRADLEKQGTPIGPNDLMIAAIARAHNVTLVTANRTEFERVAELSIECW